MDTTIPVKTGQNNAERRWVAGLLLLAFLVRWLPALVPHFWFDEVFTIAMARNSFGEILRINAADMHPPLYYSLVKCFAMAGSRLGGPFATLPWLRLASIMPGMLACLLGWGVARRYWGRGPALWTLAAFAVSPTLINYSVELRCYSALHALLLGALVGFLRATEPRPGVRRWPAMALFAGCALMAFYTHSLSTLYLAAFGVFFLAELARAGELRRALAWRGAALAGLMTLACAPWIRLMFAQTASLNGEKWLGWADWRDFRSTFFWYMPLGPLRRSILDQPWPWLVMTLIALVIILLIANAWRNRRLPVPLTNGMLPPANDDRLFLYSGLMAVLPVLVAFILSYFHIAKVFLGFRYNLVPAPFFILALLGLVFRIASRPRRAAAYGLLLSLWIVCGGFLIRQRMRECDIVGEAVRAKPELVRPESRLAWNNPTVLPWLEKCRGPYHIGSSEEILARPANLKDHRTFYLMTHLALDVNYCGLLHRPSYLLREIMKRRGIPNEKIAVGGWEAAWRLTSADIPPLAAALKSALERIEARRHAIPGGQVLLADEENFYITHGWGPLQYGPDLLPERWGEGPRQRLQWSGPPRPGLYRLRLICRRPHPFPEKIVTVRYRLPGQREWRSQQAGPGQVVIEGEVKVNVPGEKLHLHLETPTWIPARYIEDSWDDRRLGLLFEALELHPL